MFSAKKGVIFSPGQRKRSEKRQRRRKGNVLRTAAALRQVSVCNETSVQSQSEREKTVAGNENGPPSEWGEVQRL